jgi:hypothetical protein
MNPELFLLLVQREIVLGATSRTSAISPIVRAYFWFNSNIFPNDDPEALLPFF